MKSLSWITLIVLLMTSPVAAWGQEDEESASGDSLHLENVLCLHQGPTLTGESGLFTLRSGYTLCRGQWAFGTYLNKWDRRVTGIEGRDPLWNDWTLDQYRLSVGVGYGITDRIELAVSLPYDSFQSEDGFGGLDAEGHPLLQGGRLNGRTFFGDIDAEGIGNLRVAAKFQLTESDSYGLALNAFVDLPTGDDDEAVVTGETGFGLGLNWSASSWVFNVGYYDPGDPDFGEVSPQVDLGIGYAKNINERFDWITELTGAIKTEDTGRDGEHDIADITSGGRYYFGPEGDWAFNFGLRVGLSDGLDSFDNDTPIGGLLGLTWSPRRSRSLELSTEGCPGTVQSTPGSTTCKDRDNLYACGGEVSLAATPTDPTCCEFDHWSGDCSGTDANTTVSMDANKACTAHFKEKGPYTLTVKKERVGDCSEDGTVTSNPTGIDCGGTCAAPFDCGLTVNLTATPVPNRTKFQGWGGDPDCNDGSVKMDADKTCIARFSCENCYEEREQVKAQATCYFENGKSRVDNRCKLELDQVALAMQNTPNAAVDVTGYAGCSENRSSDEQAKLSYRRADAVKQYLMQRHGISTDRFNVGAGACVQASGKDSRRADVSFKVKERVQVACQ